MSERLVFEHISIFERWDRGYYSPVALRFYDEAISWMLACLNAKPGDVVLDAGCGPGVHSIRVARAGYSVHAIDISGVVLDEAERRAQAAGLSQQISFRRGDLTKLDIPDASYDRVFSWGVVIHIPEIEKALAELVRILKPGGRLALYVTNAAAWDYKLLYLLRRILGRGQLELESRRLGQGCWTGFEDDRLWVWRINVEALTKQLESLGLCRIHHIAGSLTELHTRMRWPWRNLLLHANNLWYSLGLSATPCVCNLLVFEKPASNKAGRQE